MIAFDNYEIKPSKHFALSWMLKWGLDIQDLRSALKNAYKIEKVGKEKYEAYIRHKKSSRKIIFLLYKEEKNIFIITGAEGK